MAKRLYVKLQTPSIELPVSAKDGSGAESNIIVGFRRYDIAEMEAKIAEWQEGASFDDVVKKEILYILKASVRIDEVNEAGKITSSEDVVIQDTRTAKAVEGLWDSPKECLEVLIEKYHNSMPWKAAIFDAFNSSIANTAKTAEAMLGN